MKELIKFTFDFFGHVLPGLLIILSLSLLFVDIQNANELIEKTGEFKTNVGIVVVIMAYVVGFAINPIGQYILKNLGPKLWDRKVENDIKGMFISEKYVRIREFSPANFQYVETWNTYCAMAHNFALACLVLLIVSIFHIIFKDVCPIVWIEIAIASVFLFYVFLYRSVIFHQWAGRDLNAAIIAFKLDDKTL